jgi:hypothetical protein
MLHRLIGFILGGLTIWVMLNVTNAMSGDVQPKWALSILVGLVVAWLWPWVMGIILVRRAKKRRSEEISKQVDAELKARGG